MVDGEAVACEGCYKVKTGEAETCETCEAAE
jgi:hypothetical protein